MKLGDNDRTLIAFLAILGALAQNFRKSLSPPENGK